MNFINISFIVRFVDISYSQNLALSDSIDF